MIGLQPKIMESRHTNEAVIVPEQELIRIAQNLKKGGTDGPDGNFAEK